MLMNLEYSDLIKIFGYGIDYGLLLAEEERDGEELADAFAGVIYSQKMCMPHSPIERRQAHSDKWRAAKKQSLLDFMDFLANV